MTSDGRQQVAADGIAEARRRHPGHTGPGTAAREAAREAAEERADQDSVHGIGGPPLRHFFVSDAVRFNARFPGRRDGHR